MYYDVLVRTTLTLDPDVAQRLKQRVRDRKITFKQAVNETLRRGLDFSGPEGLPRFQVEPHSCRFRPGVDLDNLNQLVDELEAEAVRDKLTR